MFRYSGGSEAIERSRSRTPREMLVQADRIFLRQALPEQRRVLPDRIEDAALALASTLHPWRRRGDRKGGAGISSGGNERSAPAQLIFLCMAPPKHSCDTPTCSERNRDSRSQFSRENLVHRWTARPAAVVARARHQRAHRRGWPSKAGIHDRGVVEPAEHVHIVAQPRQRAQARRQVVIRDRCRSGIQ